MWHELAKDQIWVADDFLTSDELSIVDDAWKEFTSFYTIEQKLEEYLLAPTYYHSKQPKRPPRSKKIIQKFVIDKLNTLYIHAFNKIAEYDNLTYAQFYFKENEPGVSRFDLHCEPGPNDKNSFGDCVFMLYLTDEIDGQLICPSEKDAEPFFNNTYNESIKHISIKYPDETQSIFPKRNRCVVVRNGTPHYVPIGTGRRKCITGWSFLDRKLVPIS